PQLCTVLEIETERDVSTRKFGSPNWGVLKRLKNSARNWTSFDSLNLKSLNTEKSTLYCAGPRRVPRRASPNRVAEVSPEANGGCANAAGLNQQKMDCRFDGHPPGVLPL